MVDFRRGITALGMFALFTGLAAAQVGGTGQQQLTCNTNVTVTPALRGEGYTEQTGDITISCTGGAQMTPGSSIPLVNIAVFYNTTVTSRLLPTTSPQSSNNTSEALLLIDEPGSGLPGAGPALPQMLCTTPLTGCAASVGGTLIANTAVVPGTTNPAPNVYQGVVNGNSVTFFGVPALPPATTGARVYRITNVRVNAQPLAGGSASGASPVQASISISGATSLSIQNSAPNVGYVSNGLTASATGGNRNQCESADKVALSTLTFQENFGTAFKTRVAAASNTAYAGQINTPAQNVPGAIYNSESNFVFPINSSQMAGLADFGTRLKATFNNIPAGVKVFVSTANVINTGTPATAPSPIGGSTGNANVATGYVGYAQLVSSETVSGGNAGGGFFPAVTATDNAGAVQIAEVSISNGTGSAVWEVINTNPNTNENFKFGVYLTYSANTAQNSPLPGVSTVNLSFAPTATSGAASSSLPIPRFAGDSQAARTLLTVNICRTILLYPYITNQAGFDTGLTIANTSQDPFTTGTNATGAQAGSCKLTYYGGTTAAPTTPPGPSDTGNIAAGTVWVNTLQAIAPNFQGYMFAVCNFQWAHGFAFISDVGARNLAMGYLAVVLNDTSGRRSNTNTTTSENGGH
ncbi:MAG: hypothetical protein ABI759_17185 [Candidatus Solibacter sp.]